MCSRLVLITVVLTLSVTLARAAAGMKRETNVQTSSVSVSSGGDGGGTYTSGFAAATGPDGKMYYVKDVNGKVEKGVIEGPLPQLDLSAVYANAFAPMPGFSYVPFSNPANLNNAIRSSVSQYIQRLGLQM